MTTKICRATHCLHDTKEINTDSDKYFQKGSCYYHSDCYKTVQDIKQIVDLWTTKINQNVVYPQLMKTLNHIIYTKHVNSDMVLFGLRYYINNHIPLNYPGGLYYVLQNKQMMQAYKTYRRKQQSNNITFIVADEEEQEAVYKPQTNRFGGIFA